MNPREVIHITHVSSFQNGLPAIFHGFDFTELVKHVHYSEDEICNQRCSAPVSRVSWQPCLCCCRIRLWVSGGVGEGG